MKRITLFILFSVLILNAFNFASAQEKIEINFFSSEICPHCAKEKEFLAELKTRYPEIEIKEYEVFNHIENQPILEDFYNKYNVPTKDQGWVPITFTPTKYFIGFNDNVANNIEECLKECLGGEGKSSHEINIPFLGKIDVSKLSLPVLTLVLGILDGFNPCAMWILVILVSLLLSLHSRKKIALVGGTFILAEGLLYFLFMTAWLNAFLAIKYVFVTRVLIGVFGIVFGILRLKDFLTWKPGVCKEIDHSGSQERIVGKMKRALGATTLPAMLLGIVILAFSVNLIEFFCSAGFPVIYTRILALQNISGIQYYFYLFFYNVLYMLDDFIVFSIAFFAFDRFSFSDKYNKYSTLAAGILILILGIVLILKPELLMFG